MSDSEYLAGLGTDAIIVEIRSIREEARQYRKDTGARIGKVEDSVSHLTGRVDEMRETNLIEKTRQETLAVIAQETEKLRVETHDRWISWVPNSIIAAIIFVGGLLATHFWPS